MFTLISAVLVVCLFPFGCVALSSLAPVYHVDKSRGNERPQRTDPRDVTKIYQLTYDTTSLMDAANITYVISDGTLLGAVRHRGLIPWDNDVDLLVPQEEMDRLTALEPAFERLGYGLKPFMLGVKVLYHPPDSFPFLDVVPFLFNSQGHSYDPINHVFDYCYLAREEMFPRKPYVFGEQQLWGPRVAEPYLDRCFNRLGGDWRTVAMVESPDHRSYVEHDEEDVRSIRAAEPSAPVNFTRADYIDLVEQALGGGGRLGQQSDQNDDRSAAGFGGGGQ